ncbi:MAG: hypothetical protein WAU53_06250, partial [Rhodoplanes sp.]
CALATEQVATSPKPAAINAINFEHLLVIVFTAPSALSEIVTSEVSHQMGYPRCDSRHSFFVEITSGQNIPCQENTLTDLLRRDLLSC